MTLKEALDLARDCGLQTVGEAVLNVEIHAPSLFVYERICEELDELYNDLGDHDGSQMISDLINGTGLI